MASGATPSMRVPFILLSVANLAVLGMRLWPWQEVMSLPGNGTTALDPAVTLLGYIGFVIWVKGSSKDPSQMAISAGTLVGLAAGFILVAEVMLEARLALISPLAQIGLFAVAGILWGIGGLRGGKAAGSAGFGMLAGAWSAMLSCLMACSGIFAGMYFAVAPQPAVQDPWKDYQGLAIGNPAVQSLVHSLNTATGFLLIGPLVGAVMGLVFAFFGQNQKG
jgi:hypothetical protein